MGTRVWQPKWWTKDRHENSWERVKEALRRDWEQTKVDLQGHGRDLNQGVEDTVKQATGSEAIPPGDQPNVKTTHPVTQPIWSDVEEPMKYGYGARAYYGAQHEAWDDKLEGTLKEEWESVKDGSHRAWNDVKAFVKRGYERATH
ncbi:MAG: hypothetical protein U0270_35855 [Labilithrix sp.]